MTARSHGTTLEGIACEAKVAHNLCPRTLHNLNTQHVNIGQAMFLQQAKLAGGVNITADNVNYKDCDVSNNVTASYGEFQQPCYLPHDNTISARDAVKFFSLDTVMLNSEQNKELKYRLDLLAIYSIGEVISKAGDDQFNWISEKLGTHHDHEFFDSAAEKSQVFINNIHPFDENKTPEMIQILFRLQDFYLATIACSQGPEFQEAVDVMKNPNKSRQERRKCQEEVWQVCEEGGLLVLHGDELTCERYESARKCQVFAATYYEQLRFIKCIRPGHFHALLNKLKQDMAKKLPVLTNVADKTSMAALKTATGLKYISNDPDDISKHYERTRQFQEAITDVSIISAWGQFTSKVIEHEQTKEGAMSLIKEFMNDTKIQYYYDPDMEATTQYKDDCEKDCIDNINRGLLGKMLDRAIADGDGKGIRACSLVLVLYFLNRSDIQNSKYAPLMLEAHIDFLRMSSMDQFLIDRYATINTQGTRGHNKSHDMHEENIIKRLKKLLNSTRNKTGLQLDKKVLSMQVIDLVVENEHQAVGLVKSGNSRYSYLSQQQMEDLMEVFEQTNPFNPERPTLSYKQNLPSMWEGEAMSVPNIERFLTRNSGDYVRSRSLRAF